MMDGMDVDTNTALLAYIITDILVSIGRSGRC